MNRLLVALLIFLAGTLAAWQGRVFRVEGKKVIVTSQASAEIKPGTRLYVIEGGKVAGEGTAIENFHTRITMSLTSGSAHDGSTVTTEPPVEAGDETPLGAGTGEKWTLRKLPRKAFWRSVAYGNGIFVAVGYPDIVATSTNGIRWTERKLPEKQPRGSMAFGNGVFVVTGGENAVISNDGIEWKSGGPLGEKLGFDTTFGNGTFVTISSGSDHAAASRDGLTWTRTTLPKTGHWYSVAYGNGKFVSIGIERELAVSADGLSWQGLALPEARAYLGRVTFGNGIFVATGLHAAAYSVDGENWIVTPLNHPGHFQVTYGNNRFVAVNWGAGGGSDNSGKTAAVSADGKTWTFHALPKAASWTSITSGRGIFVAVSGHVIEGQESDIAATSP